VQTLCAVALSAPTKSDLQQRDIVLVRNPALRSDLERLMPSVDWLPGVPALLVVCGNNRRQRRLHELRGRAAAARSARRARPALPS
jgi:nitroreductase/FMN reductase [NAD(P)H]